MQWFTLLLFDVNKHFMRNGWLNALSHHVDAPPQKLFTDGLFGYQQGRHDQ